MDNDKFIIPIDDLVPKFSKHLELHGNSRILFSGKFGIGKTVFLKEFFKRNDSEYDVYHLYPVNYQISSNENIFEFLKKDILVELLTKTDIFDGNNDLDKSFIDFIKSQWNTKSVLRELIENGEDFLPFNLGKLGKPLKTALDLDEKFQQFKQDGNKSKIKSFLKENNEEPDIISEIIKNKIQQSKGKKNSVLILDDLDRIDPEHIFRILNVFSAHFDQNNGNNKFGFDKIIIVADYENLESIFHHRFGENTDSSGYFDKFFCVEVFHFNNRELITRFTGEIINKFNKDIPSTTIEVFDVFVKIIMLNLIMLHGKRQLSIRQMLAPLKYPLLSLNQKERLHINIEDPIKEGMNIGIEVLLSLYKTEELLLQALRSLTENPACDYWQGNIPTTFSSSMLENLYTIKEDTSSIETKTPYYIGLNSKQIVTINNQKIDNYTETKLQFNLFIELLIEYIENHQYIKVQVNNT